MEVFFVQNRFRIVCLVRRVGTLQTAEDSELARQHPECSVGVDERRHQPCQLSQQGPKRRLPMGLIGRAPDCMPID